jgi:8-oxo-dGTP pyrophosphatase MutT (NUDIX family)
MKDDRRKWKTLSSEYIYNDNWFNARKDKCERPNGRIVEPYYVLEYPDWVTALAVTNESKIVLIKQYRHALGEVCIETPGGCVDAADSDYEVAVKRELLEETGYAFNSATFLGTTSPNPSVNANLMYMYLLQGGRKVQEQDLDANEDIEVLLTNFDELKGMLDRKEIVQSMHVTTIFYALQKLGKLQLI